MAIERERKFLVKDDTWREDAGNGVLYLQGYIHSDADKAVRIRVAGGQGLITIKGSQLKDDPTARPEYEYEIPRVDAKEMLKSLCADGYVEKMRYIIPYKGFAWEVDEFLGDNSGLVLAEIEFQNEGQEIPLPEWIAEEVTTETKYINANLAIKPYTTW